jgi:hypothetical protein
MSFFQKPSAASSGTPAPAPARAHAPAMVSPQSIAGQSTPIAADTATTIAVAESAVLSAAACLKAIDSKPVAGLKAVDAKTSIPVAVVTPAAAAKQDNTVMDLSAEDDDVVLTETVVEEKMKVVENILDISDETETATEPKNAGAKRKPPLSGQKTPGKATKKSKAIAAPSSDASETASTDNLLSVDDVAGTCTPPLPKKKRASKSKASNNDEAASEPAADSGAESNADDAVEVVEAVSTPAPAAAKAKAPRKRKAPGATPSTTQLTADDSVIIEMSESLAEATTPVSAGDGAGASESAPAETDKAAESAKPRASRQKKPTAKAVAAAATESAAIEVVAEEQAVVVAPSIQLTEADLLRINLSTDRINNLVSDLMNLEACPDLKDTMLEVNEACVAVMTFLEVASSVPVAATTGEDGETQRTIEPIDHLLFLVRCVMARRIQGSRSPLSVLNTEVGMALFELKSKLQPLVQGTQSAEIPVDGDASTIMHEDKELDPSRVQICYNLVDKLCDSSSVVILNEEIKQLAAREAHGNRTSKVLLPFEDTDEVCLWRWEVNLGEYFSSTALAAVKEIRRIRGHFGRAIKSAAKVIEQIQKTPTDEAKISVCEEKATKSYSEVEKVREKRREMDRKRAADAESKRQKEIAKEVKRKEKEEADEKKAAAAAAAADKKFEKVKAVTEKDVKKAESLEKSKNLFMNFLKPKPGDSTASSSSSSSSSSATKQLNPIAMSSPISRLGPLLKLDDTSSAPANIAADVDDVTFLQSNCSSSSMATNAARVIASNIKSSSRVVVPEKKVTTRKNSNFDEESFDKVFNCGMTMGDIQKSFMKK